MFSANLQDDVFQNLLCGFDMLVWQRDEAISTEETTFLEDHGPGATHRLPDDGTHFMILNGEKMLVKVSTDSSEPDGCPCCAWDLVYFKLVA